MRRRREVALRLLFAALSATVVWACANSYTARRQAEQALETGEFDRAAAVLEAAKRKTPSDPELFNALGETYYKRARRALDEGRLEAYTADLGRALDAWVESARLRPDSPSPHNWMGIVAAYQGDLRGALLNFNNARKLEPLHPVYYLNIAQTYIYRGDLPKARRWMEAARRRGAPPTDIELLSMQAAWRGNDMVEAIDLFEGVHALDPEGINRWAGDAARVPGSLDSFDEYARYCCSNPGCGPYMEDACRARQLEVERRRVNEETLRQELVLEMERRRRLEQIYRERKDLEITIDSPEPTR